MVYFLSWEKKEKGIAGKKGIHHSGLRPRKEKKEGFHGGGGGGGGGIYFYLLCFWRSDFMSLEKPSRPQNRLSIKSGISLLTVSALSVV